MARKEESPTVLVTSVKIPRQEVPWDGKGEVFIDVMVGEVVSPDKLYIQVMNNNISYDMDDLVDDMEDWYNSQMGGSSMLVQLQDIKVGLNCAARPPPEDKWYRAVVTGFGVLGTVQVFLIDFGGDYRVELSDLRWLLAKFCSLPGQAVLARLADIGPPAGHRGWPDAACRRLLDLTRLACERDEGLPRGLVARPEQWEDDVLVVRLFDTVTNQLEEGLDLASLLVEEGLARDMVAVVSSSLAVELSGPGVTAESSLQGNKVEDTEGKGTNCAEENVEETQEEEGEDSIKDYGAVSLEEESQVAQLKKLLELRNQVHSVMTRLLPEEKERDREVADLFMELSEQNAKYLMGMARLISRVKMKSKPSADACGNENVDHLIGTADEGDVGIYWNDKKEEDVVVSNEAVEQDLATTDNVLKPLFVKESNNDLKRKDYSVAPIDLANELVSKEKFSRDSKENKKVEVELDEDQGGDTSDQTHEEGKSCGNLRLLELGEGKTLHPVFLEEYWFVASWEVSGLNKQWLGYDLLTRMLERRKVKWPRVYVGPSTHLYQELSLTRGISLQGEEVLLYRLSDLLDILDCVGVKLSQGEKEVVLQFVEGH